MFVFPGFNSNIDHRNKKYHIQTEVNSVYDVTKINTMIYFSGRIFYSLTSDMSVEDSSDRDMAVSAVRKQHNKVIRDLISDQLEPQKSTSKKETINFESMYGTKEFLSCQNEKSINIFDVFKELILSPD